MDKFIQKLTFKCHTDAMEGRFDNASTERRTASSARHSLR